MKNNYNKLDTKVQKVQLIITILTQQMEKSQRRIEHLKSVAELEKSS